MVKRFVFAIWLLSVAAALHAAITIDEITSKPASRARDFLIWEFLRQKGVDEKSAKAAFALVKNKNNIRLKRAYAKVVDDEVRKELQCKKRKRLLSIKDTACLRAAFSLSKTLHYSRFQRDELIARDLEPEQKQLLKLQNEPYSFTSYKRYDPEYVISYIASISKKILHDKLNEELDFDTLSLLQSAPNFGSFVAMIVTDYEMDKVQKSLLRVDGEKIKPYTNFLLALNALRHSDKTRALEYLKLYRKKVQEPMQRDKADFWLYLVTQKRNYLENLLLSMSINIYTLYAHEKMHIDIENYFTTLHVQNRPSEYNLQNPFDWLKILEEIHKTDQTNLFDLVKRFQSRDLVPVQRYVLERAYDFKMHGYLMPYDAYMRHLSLQDKALVYAIMRQESNYIPSALSRSFALGLMQLMPFLVDHIAKKEKDKIESYSEMFKPSKNLKYAFIHLRWLKKILKDNPLFIAYAYNGGYGFFTRYRRSGRFGKGEYEPYLSMELMRNAETREYGKRVLANYVMYRKIYNEAFSLISFFETLK